MAAVFISSNLPVLPLKVMILCTVQNIQFALTDLTLMLPVLGNVVTVRGKNISHRFSVHRNSVLLKVN